VLALNDYSEASYLIFIEKGNAKVSDVVKRLNLRVASVTEGFHSLARMALKLCTIRAFN
jgi:Mn-dependent DtxR family transcriptional regulator